MTTLSASTGWTWLKQGAVLLRQQPAGLTTLMFANIFVSLLIGTIPFLGPMVAVILMPSFSMALMQACRMIDAGERVMPSVWLTGFRKPALATLARVGLVYLAVSLVLTIAMRFAISPEFWEQIAEQNRGGATAQLAGGDLLTMMSIVVLNVIALIALCYAAPLTQWQAMPPMKAVFYSVYAVKRGAGVFAVMLLAWVGIFLGVSMLVTLLLGGGNIARILIMWLIFLFMLWLQCGLYVGYREIFGKPDARRDEGEVEKVDLSK